MAVAALTAATVFIASYLILPVSGVLVVGARMFPVTEAQNAVPEHASLLTLNTAALEKRIESNPWVESAVVTKRWKSGTVTVQVEERRAILDAQVDGRRVILAEDGVELPGLGGASLRRVKLDEDQLAQVSRCARVLAGGGVALDSVDEVGPGGIEATVEGRRVVFSEGVGADQARALEEVMADHPGAPVFDLRSRGRIVVGGTSNGGASGEPEG